MLSFISNIATSVSSIFYSNDMDKVEDDNNEAEEDEAELLHQIIGTDDLPVPQVSSANLALRNADNDEMFKCFQKTGKVTFLSPEYGLIDNSIYFEPNKVGETFQLEINMIVVYLAYKEADNQTDKVFKILAQVNRSWDDNNVENENVALNENPKNLPASMEFQTINRIINGQVVLRRERQLVIEPSGTRVNLDDIEAAFVPVEGDWVALGAKVSVDENVTDLAGEVIEIKTLKPLCTKRDIGTVTLWNLLKKGEGEGAIEKNIYFHQEFCESGYIPSLGDTVIYEAIESEQGSYNWRAIGVWPVDIPNHPSNSMCNFTEKEQLCRDKQSMSILGSLNFREVRLNETRELVLEVKNFGKQTQILLRVRFHVKKHSSQITLKSPGLDDRFIIKPGESVKYIFEARGRHVGYSSELVVFTFKNFKIGRELELNVLMEKDLNKLLPTDLKTHYKKSFHQVARQNFLKTADIEDRSRTFGAKPKVAPKFIKGERPGRYKIPERLWKVILGDSGMPKPHRILYNDVGKYAMFLQDELKAHSYSDRFHLLLYLEEAALRLEIRQFDMEGVIMRRAGDYLKLEVPGLQESRPSLIIGDRVVVQQPWLENDNEEHVGYIYEIHQKDVYIKFHPSFHNKYDESDCNIYFESNMGNLQRSHDAINRAMRKLGEKWLFPSAVQEKQEQIVFESIEDYVEPAETAANSGEGDIEELLKKISLGNTELDWESILHEKDLETEYDVDENGFLFPRKQSQVKKELKHQTNNKVNRPDSEDKKIILKKRKLTWFNKTLNEHQKASIVNVLKGKGRPLPYIIFGPPGTGKTITLVETILQIYTLMPESRILVGTPSNSSADLLCERLIDSGALQPGELTRIMAYHRACEGNIPEKIIPFCTTTDLRDDKGDPDMFVKTENVLKQSSLSQLIGRNRITIGTCSALGQMHYMGFPNGHFTHILVDEAGQALEPEILIPISFLDPRKGQVILAGDPEQLGPICISKIAEEYGLGFSLLQRFVQSFPYIRDHVGFPNTNGYDPRFITRLCINYRSLPEILNLPSQLFYNNELVPTISSTDSVEFDLCCKLNKQLDIRQPPPAIIFHGVRGQNYQADDCPSWYNPQEIWQCIQYLMKCYSIGLTADQCGIVTPYKKQVQKLRQLLVELEMAVPKIGTVEDFQGQERYVIILSAVRSSLSYIGTDIKHSLGFVASPRRLNVALTRARALLIIVGNPHLLSTDPYWRSVLIYCVKNESFLGCDLPNNLADDVNEVESPQLQVVES